MIVKTFKFIIKYIKKTNYAYRFKLIQLVRFKENFNKTNTLEQTNYIYLQSIYKFPSGV